jgi:hypothetical protein
MPVMEIGHQPNSPSVRLEKFVRCLRANRRLAALVRILLFGFNDILREDIWKGMSVARVSHDRELGHDGNKKLNYGASLKGGTHGGRTRSATAL